MLPELKLNLESEAPKQKTDHNLRIHKGYVYLASPHETISESETDIRPVFNPRHRPAARIRRLIRRVDDTPGGIRGSLVVNFFRE